jgi:hypothetical protein
METPLLQTPHAALFFVAGVCFGVLFAIYVWAALDWWNRK